MVISDRRLNIEYSLVQSFYWMGFCVCVSFATVFLQGRGYSNFSLGLILAVGNVAGFLLAPFLASLIDKGKKVTVFNCLWGLLLVELVMLASFLALKSSGFLLSAMYCLYIACNTAVNPLNTQMNFELGGWSGRINYGAARGIGSLAFAPTAILLGRLTKNLDSGILPYAGLIIVSLQCLILAVITVQRKRGLMESGEKPEVKGEALSIGSFIRSNPHFSFLMLGIALIFFSHNLIGNFLINVVRNVGGDTAIMGSINGFMALLELPVMLLYTAAARKIRCSTLLRFSFLVFVLKALGVALAPTVEWLFAAEALQALSFALMTPAIVQYTSVMVGPRDSAKGQSLSAGMTTLGSALAGGIGGLLYDSLSVRATLFIGVAISLIGATVCQLAIEKNSPKV